MATQYLLVVRTEGIAEGGGAPPDAVVSASYWNPGDRDWIHVYDESLEKVIQLIASDSDWTLVQQDDFNAPYEHQLIFACPRSDFEAPT
jgi:hypothetical protein